MMFNVEQLVEGEIVGETEALRENTPLPLCATQSHINLFGMKLRP
jgi:hypothetical protein